MSGAPPTIEEGGLRRAFRVQRNVVGALVMREIHTRFGRENLGYLWLFLEPMILASAIAGLHKFAGHGLPGGIEVFAFYVVGYTPYYLFRALLNRAASSLEQNHQLLYHARVSLFDIMLSRTILECAAVLGALAVFLSGIGVATGVWPHDWLKIAGGTIGIALLCHGFALMLLAATRWGVGTVDRIVHPFTYLSIPFTGAFVMVWWFPTEWHGAILSIPTFHCFEMIRDGYYGPVVPHLYDPSYILLCAAALNLLGMAALRAARPHLEH